MLTVEEKAKIVKFVYECGSIIKAQRRFYREMKEPAPERHSILRWVRQFEKSGTIVKSKSNKSCGRPKLDHEKINEVHELFLIDPKASIRRASCELFISRSSVHRILHNELKLKAYKVQMVQTS